MINMSKANTARVVALAAVAVVAMFTFAGAAYAYTATYTDSFDGQTTDEEYVIVTGGDFTLTAQTIDAVWNSATTGSGTPWEYTTTYSNGHFVKDIGTASGDSITTVTYELGTITVTKYNDDGSAVVSGLNKSSFTFTLSEDATIPTGGNKDATMKENTDYTIVETGSGTGTYTVSIVFKLITLGNTEADVGYEYYIPGYSLTVSYAVAESA